jgi:hypothetical protein
MYGCSWENTAGRSIYKGKVTKAGRITFTYLVVSITLCLQFCNVDMRPSWRKKMKNEKLFENLSLPAPPPELRKKAIERAGHSLASQPALSWTDRVGANRGGRYFPGAGLALGCLILLFWNPPLPGTNPVRQSPQISDNDENAIDLVQSSLRVFAHLKSLNDLRALEEGDL